MAILHIEHPITDLDTWLQAFTTFASAREQAGVLETHVYQPDDDDHYIVVNLRFESAFAAEKFREFLAQNVWASPAASPGLAGTPATRILNEVAA